MFYYAVMQRVMSDSKLRQCGFRPKEGSYLTDREQFAAAGRITAKQQAALVRAFLVDYFRSAAPEYGCTDETLLTGMMCPSGYHFRNTGHSAWGCFYKASSQV